MPEDYIKAFEIRRQGAAILSGIFGSSFVDENAYACLFSSRLHQNKACDDAFIKIRYKSDQLWDILLYVHQAKKIIIENAPFKLLDKTKFWDRKVVEKADIAVYLRSLGEDLCSGEFLIFEDFTGGRKSLRCDSPAKALVEGSTLKIEGIEKKWR